MTRNSKLLGLYDIALVFGLDDGETGFNTAPEAMVKDLPRVVTVSLIGLISSSDRVTSLSFAFLLSLEFVDLPRLIFMVELIRRADLPEVLNVLDFPELPTPWHPWPL
jgi:hypothetical protein